jgi:hypothetical protein
MLLIVNVFAVNHQLNVQETRNGTIRNVVVFVIKNLNVNKANVGMMSIVNVFPQSLALKVNQT